MIVKCKNKDCTYYKSCEHSKLHEPMKNSLRKYCNIPSKNKKYDCLCLPIIDKELDKIFEL